MLLLELGAASYPKGTALGLSTKPLSGGSDAEQLLHCNQMKKIAFKKHAKHQGFYHWTLEKCSEHVRLASCVNKTGNTMLVDRVLCLTCFHIHCFLYT